MKKLLTLSIIALLCAVSFGQSVNKKLPVTDSINSPLTDQTYWFTEAGLGSYYGSYQFEVYGLGWSDTLEIDLGGGNTYNFMSFSTLGSSTVPYLFIPKNEEFIQVGSDTGRFKVFQLGAETHQLYYGGVQYTTHADTVLVVKRTTYFSK